ncbi:MAG: alpha/beta fold hydrolase [Antricoccus sp.]
MSVYSRPVPGLVMIDHTIDVPLDWSRPEGATISIYAREVRGTENADHELPWLLFLQGGPGGKSPRPLSRSGWLDAALAQYRVLLLDQRGTGRSTPITARMARAMNAAQLAAYLEHHRAPSIVRDAEAFRATIGGAAPWSTLGQSYGGFCTLSYLSIAPEGLAKCLITGGIPPIGFAADQVYERTWQQVLAKNAEYFRRFPGDRGILNAIRDHLSENSPARLPGGDRLTVNRLQALGIAFGGSTGFAQVHYLLEEAFDGPELSATFLAAVENATSQATSPLYALLQEAIYCEGISSRWAATRTRADCADLATTATNLLFTGEMMERWRFTDQAALAPFVEVADLLHAKSDWGPLYDRSRLAENSVPVAAAVYYDDMYVEAGASLAAAQEVPLLRPWVTNEYEHDGLRNDTAVFLHLHDLATGRA